MKRLSNNKYFDFLNRFYKLMLSVIRMWKKINKHNYVITGFLKISFKLEFLIFKAVSLPLPRKFWKIIICSPMSFLNFIIFLHCFYILKYNRPTFSRCLIIIGDRLLYYIKFPLHAHKHFVSWQYILFILKILNENEWKQGILSSL